MGKPTVLLEIEPFLLDTPSIGSFIHQSAFMAQKLEDRFSGVSLKLTGSDSTNIMAEFRWQGTVVVHVRDLGPKYGEGRIGVHCPQQVNSPQYVDYWYTVDYMFDRAFLDIIESRLVRLNELKLNIQNRNLSRGGVK